MQGWCDALPVMGPGARWKELAAMTGAEQAVEFLVTREASTTAAAAVAEAAMPVEVAVGEEMEEEVTSSRLTPTTAINIIRCVTTSPRTLSLDSTRAELIASQTAR